MYKIPVGPNQLDPTVFYLSQDNTPKLLPSIYSQIVKDIETLTSGQPSRVKNYYLVGEATKPGSKNRSAEIRILVVLNKNIMDLDIDGLLAEDLLKLAKNLSGKLAVGTTRPIHYIPTIRSIETYDYEGIYNLFTNDWVKIPNGLTQ